MEEEKHYVYSLWYELLASWNMNILYKALGDEITQVQ